MKLPPFHRNAWLFLASVTVGGIASSILQLFFNLYVLALGHDKQFLGLLSSVASGVILFLGLPIGLLIDRTGRRFMLITGGLLTGLGTVVLVASASQWIMVAGALVFGLGQAAVYLSTAPFIMQVTDDRTRTSLFSTQFGLLNLAGFGGSLLAGYLPGWLHTAFGLALESAEVYRIVLLVSAALACSTVLPFFVMHGLAEPALSPKAAAPTPLLQSLPVLTRPLILKLVAPNLLVGFGAAILIPYLNVFFKERHNLSDDWLGILFSLAAVATGVATLLGPQLAARVGKVRATVLTQGASLLFILFIGFWPNLWVAAFAALMRGALMNMAGPLFQAFTMEQLPDHERATVNSAQTMMWNVGWTVGPALSGWVQQLYGFTPLFLATTVLYTLATGMTFVFFRHSETPPVAKAAGLEGQEVRA